MIQVNDRVRHKDEKINAKYGVMQVWQIKGGSAFCRYGDFHNMDVVTFSLTELIKTND